MMFKVARIFFENYAENAEYFSPFAVSRRFFHGKRDVSNVTLNV